MTYVVGVDGGGTKTKAVIATLDGEILSGVQAGMSNFQRVGREGVKQVFVELLSKFKEKLRISATEISCWGIGLAGAGRREDQEAVVQALKSLSVNGRIAVQSDAYIALMGAFSGEPGIIIISGTGSICFGLDEKGQIHRSGGWGYLLGDEGSGYFIGHQGVLAALKDQDARGEQTRLRREIEKALGLASIDQIVRKVYIEHSIQKEDIANLAPLVFACAVNGDRIARQIVSHTGREIARLILAVAQKMGKLGKKIQVAYIGSVFKQKHVLLPEILKELRPHFRDILLAPPAYEPAIGAIIWALQEQGLPVDSLRLERLNRSYELA